MLFHIFGSFSFLMITLRSAADKRVVPVRRGKMGKMAEEIRSIMLVTAGGAATLSLSGFAPCEGEIDGKFQEGHECDLLNVREPETHFGVKLSEVEIVSFVSLL